MIKHKLKLIIVPAMLPLVVSCATSNPPDKDNSAEEAAAAAAAAATKSLEIVKSVLNPYVKGEVVSATTLAEFASEFKLKTVDSTNNLLGPKDLLIEYVESKLASTLSIHNGDPIGTEPTPIASVNWPTNDELAGLTPNSDMLKMSDMIDLTGDKWYNTAATLPDAKKFQLSNNLVLSYYDLAALLHEKDVSLDTRSTNLNRIFNSPLYASPDYFDSIIKNDWLLDSQHWLVLWSVYETNKTNPVWTPEDKAFFQELNDIKPFADFKPADFLGDPGSNESNDAPIYDKTTAKGKITSDAHKTLLSLYYQKVRSTNLFNIPKYLEHSENDTVGWLNRIGITNSPAFKANFTNADVDTTKELTNLSDISTWNELITSEHNYFNNTIDSNILVTYTHIRTLEHLSTGDKYLHTVEMKGYDTRSYNPYVDFTKPDYEQTVTWFTNA